MVLDILAKYYSGIPFNTWGMYTGPIPRNSQFQQGDSDKWPINTNMPWGSVEFEWDHPINHYEGRPEGYTNPNLDIGRALRGDYGFKRPFFEQSHHYFAFLKFAYDGPDNVIWNQHYDREITSQLEGAYKNWQDTRFNKEGIEQFNQNERYAWVYQESVRDLYLMSRILEDAEAIRTDGISTLPSRLEFWCANDEADVWSLEDEVNKFYYDYPEEYWPLEEFRPPANE